MKLIMLVLSLFVLSLNALAIESETFTFDGSESVKEILLAKDIYRTEYRTEERPSTCYRQVMIGYRPVCHYETRQACHWIPRTCHTVTRDQCTTTRPVCRDVCHNGPNGRICRPVCSGGGTVCRPVATQVCNGGFNQCRPYSQQVCRQVPDYREEAYACTRTDQVPYQVFDHHVDAKIVMNFSELPQGIDAHEVFTVGLAGPQAVISVKSSKKVLIFMEKKQEVVVTGSTKYLNAEIKIKFQDLEKLKAAMSPISQVSLRDNTLIFALGKAGADIKFKHKLNIEEKRFLARKLKLIDRELADFEVQSFVQDGQQFFAINLEKLGLKLKNKKHKISISSQALIGESHPLNHQDLPQLKVTKEVDIKL